MLYCLLDKLHLHINDIMKTKRHFSITFSVLLLATLFMGCSKDDSGPDGYALGDPYPNATAPIGVVFWLDNPVEGRSLHGKIVSLKEENMDRGNGEYGVIWGPDIQVGASSESDGKANTSAVSTYISSHAESWSDFPCFYWVINMMNGKTSDYNPEQDLWYLPSITEMKVLFAGFSGKNYKDEYWIHPDAAMTDYNSAEVQNAQAKFNQQLTSAGGTAIDTKKFPWYMSSTEISKSGMFDLNISNGQRDYGTKILIGRVRAIRTF